MSKVKSTFCCQNCGAQHSKWLGQCSACKEWNTIVEEIIKKENTPTLGLTKDQLSSKIQLIGDVDFNNDPRLNIADEEFNRVLGGGIVPGSLILIGGEPGIGKSTLLLQISLMIIIKYFMFQEKRANNKFAEELIGLRKIQKAATF